MDIRIGHGFDAHRFGSDGALVLAGVSFPSCPRLKAHSDGDVAVHALCDAVLGALALGDIGRFFPDRDPQYAGIDSRILLRRVIKMARERGYAVSNADLTVMAQKPKLAPRIDEMRAVLAADLGILQEAVSVKATTVEGMGAIGREEGIAVTAVVLLTGSGRHQPSGCGD